MESAAVVGRRLRVVRELYSAPNGCRVFRVSDVHAPHQPEYALKQVSFDSPEGPRAVMHEAGVFSSLRHDCILRHVASWTSDADVAQLDDDARVMGARRSRMRWWVRCSRTPPPSSTCRRRSATRTAASSR